MLQLMYQEKELEEFSGGVSLGSRREGGEGGRGDSLREGGRLERWQGLGGRDMVNDLKEFLMVDVKEDSLYRRRTVQEQSWGGGGASSRCNHNDR